MLAQKELVGQGVAPIPPGASQSVAAAIAHGSHAAFMSGLHLSMLVAAVVTLIGAALTPLIRRGDPMPKAPSSRSDASRLTQPYRFARHMV